MTLEAEVKRLPLTNRMTLRLPTTIVQILKAEAEKKDLPLNALVSKILNKSIAFDRNINVLPIVVIPNQLFIQIIDSVDDAAMDSIVNEGLTTLKKLFVMLGKRYELREIIDNHFVILEKYCGWYNFIYESENSHHRLVFEIRLGHKWTRFVFTYVKSVLESLRSLHMEYESINDNVIVFEVREYLH